MDQTSRSAPFSAAGHRQRLRERFLNSGLQGFHDYEVVELLLSLGTPRKDCKQMAKNALKMFGSLRMVLQATPKELERIQGTGPNNIFSLKLAQSISRRYLEERIIMKNAIQSSSDVTDYLRHMLGERNLEIFLVLYLNGSNQVLKSEELFTGTLNEAAAYPREVVKKTIENNAAALILVHNHPSGRCEPSDQDKILTARLVAALKTIDVIIHDHIIIAGNEHYSFADHGLL